MIILVEQNHYIDYITDNNIWRFTLELPLEKERKILKHFGNIKRGDKNLIIERVAKL